MRLASFLALFVVACSNAPSGNVEPPATIHQLEVLDAWFVRVQGERMPLDDFLYRMRLRGQEWATRQVRGRDRVGIKLTGNVKALSARELERVLDDLRLSGVQWFDL